MKLGTYPAIKTDGAREKVRPLEDAVKHGQDPAAAERQRKHWERQKAANLQSMQEIGDVPEYLKKAEPGTFAAEFLNYYNRKILKNYKRPDAVLHLFGKHIFPKFGDLPFDSISKTEISDFLDDLVDQGMSVGANRVYGALRTFYNWIEERHEDDAYVSPMRKLRPPVKETSRERWLSAEEIKNIWKACEHLGFPFGSFVRALLLTAQRRHEVSDMQWSEVDLDKAIWTIPAERTKSGREHEVPLSPQAVAFLKDLPRLGDYVFSRDGKKPISGFSKAKRRLDRFSDVTDFTFHDIRRSVATHMEEAGIQHRHVAFVLNPAAVQDVTGIYTRSDLRQFKRDALEKWGAILERMVVPQPENVVALHG